MPAFVPDGPQRVRGAGRLLLGVTLLAAAQGCGEGFRSEPGPPRDGLLLWLRADRGVTAHNGVVSKWADQSDQRADAVQTASNVRPTFTGDAFAGMGAVSFDGEGDFMKLPAGFTDFGQGLSFFATIEVTRDDTCTALFEVSNGSEIDDIHCGRYLGAPIYEVFDQECSDGALAVGSPQIVAAIHRPDESVEVRVNGALACQTMLPLPANVTRGQNFIGNTLYSSCGFFVGHVAELLVYQRAVDDGELLDIERTLGEHAGCCQ